MRPRTQTSVAVSGDGDRWVLLNAAPDLRAQVSATPELHPRDGTRGSPISAVVLTGAEIDQTAGLLNLRERQAFTLFGTAETLAALADNPMFDALAPDVVARRAIGLGQAFDLPGGISAELFAVPGKLPLYLEGENPDIGAETGANVGIEVRVGDATLVFVPGCASVPPALKRRLRDAQVALFDATLFTDDEMIRTDTGTKTGRRMGHMPIDGVDGTLAALADVTARRVFIHINNTNPILVAGSPERRRVEQAGWEVAEDGMRIVL